MLPVSVAVIAAMALFADACPHHDHVEGNALARRAQGSEWAYEASYNWHTLNSNYSVCQTGAQQSPIALPINQGLSATHNPEFSFPNGTLVRGNLNNWGYGPAFTLLNEMEGNYTDHPQLRFDNTTVYLEGWHIHSPADHSVGGDRSKAELHVVYGDAVGHEGAVLAIRLDPGQTNSEFFDQFRDTTAIDSISWTDTQTRIPMELDFALLNGPTLFNEFWTYAGSLTSPPCTEGIRWFVARQIVFVNIQQMQSILSVSTFSARAEQEIWLHGVNA